ncbi:MAG: hypothetical protein F6K24_19240 [Okeania sp. SIO2D1]|nr:hypothetical protein [Okeania sp. SIO2D1]
MVWTQDGQRAGLGHILTLDITEQRRNIYAAGLENFLKKIKEGLESQNVEMRIQIVEAPNDDNAQHRGMVEPLVTEVAAQVYGGMQHIIKERLITSGVRVVKGINILLDNPQIKLIKKENDPMCGGGDDPYLSGYFTLSTGFEELSTGKFADNAKDAEPAE